MLPLVIIPLLSAFPSVFAHGFVHEVNIASKPYIGNVPNASPTPSIVRQINDVSPVKGATNQDINCGHSAQIANLNANANPGDNITFDWRGGDLSQWPHNIGPMLTYMASCGSSTCDKFDSTTAKWFKIDQVGKEADGKTWVQQVLMNGGVANVTLPPNIAPGNYLIRHEIIALHLATEQGGAEFYPSCSQLVVGGSGTGAPTASELVSLPGAYSDNDPGIFDPTVFDTGAPYTFPGPPVAQFVVAAGSDNGGNASDSGSSSSSTSTSGGAGSGSGSGASNSTTPASSGSNSGSSSSSRKGQCNLKSSSSGNNNRKRAWNGKRPRHVSRVMRHLKPAISA